MYQNFHYLEPQEQPDYSLKVRGKGSEGAAVSLAQNEASAWEPDPRCRACRDHCVNWYLASQVKKGIFPHAFDR